MSPALADGFLTLDHQEVLDPYLLGSSSSGFQPTSRAGPPHTHHN